MDERECEYDMGGCRLRYKITAEGVCVCGFQGNVRAVTVPEQIEGKPVTAIERKTFLSKKSLRKIELPGGLLRIGDWAFAYCGGLERVTIPIECRHMGRALFLDCERLECVTGIRGAEYGRTSSGEVWSEECGRLLAAAVTRMEAYYLLEPSQVGSREWLEKWDARLAAVIRTGDQEGYSRQVLCGEEDYGSTDLNAFLQTKRQKKVRLAMLRLLCDEGLSDEMRLYLEGYLLSHTRGCESEESWQVVLEEGEIHPEYARLFLRLGCANRENIEDMIRQMGEEQPQLRATFLRYQQDQLGHGDFFAGLSL